MLTACWLYVERDKTFWSATEILPELQTVLKIMYPFLTYSNPGNITLDWVFFVEFSTH